MARQKYFYYVGVRVEGGMAFVTGINNSNRYAKWEIDKEPEAFGHYTALSICEGLGLNGFNACVIQALYPWNRHAVSVKE